MENREEKMKVVHTKGKDRKLKKEQQQASGINVLLENLLNLDVHLAILNIVLSGFRNRVCLCVCVFVCWVKA